MFKNYKMAGLISTILLGNGYVYSAEPQIYVEKLQNELDKVLQCALDQYDKECDDAMTSCKEKIQFFGNLFKTEHEAFLLAFQEGKDAEAQRCQEKMNQLKLMMDNIYNSTKVAIEESDQRFKNRKAQIETTLNKFYAGEAGIEKK